MWAGSAFLIALLAYWLGKSGARAEALQKEKRDYELYRTIHQANCTRSRVELLERLRGRKSK